MILDGEWIVMVDCGYSEWFKVRDMRVYGRFETADEARIWGDKQEANVTGRDGEPIGCTVMPIADWQEGVTI